MANNSPVVGILDRITARAQQAASRLRVKSALNPMLWLCAIVSPLAFVLAFFSYWLQLPDLGIMFVYVGAAPIGATILGFLYLASLIPSVSNLRSIRYD